jgi:hypothetical protein
MTIFELKQGVERVFLDSGDFLNAICKWAGGILQPEATITITNLTGRIRVIGNFDDDICMNDGQS